MNIITVQLSEQQYDDLLSLLDYAEISLVSDRKSILTVEEERDIEDRLEVIAVIHQNLTDSKSYLWTSGCGRIELEIPAEAVEAIAQPGDNEAAVKAWLEGEETNYLRAQVERMDAGEIRDYLEGVGLDGVDEMSPATRRQYFLWMACHDINDERNQKD